MPPSPSPGQPRWAWWVVGILVPVTGIAATLIAGAHHSKPPPVGAAGPGPALSQSPGTATGAPSPESTAPATGSGERAGGSDGKVRFGPANVSFPLDGGGRHIDFDSTPPLVGDTGAGGSDLDIETTTGSAIVLNDHIAPLSPSGAAPGEAECADRVLRNSTYTIDLTRGARFCMETDEGRTVYVRAVAAPVGTGTVRLDVTVWDLPG